MKTATDRISIAQEAFEAGFQSKTAQSRALGELNRGYEEIRRKLMNVMLGCRTPENNESVTADYFAFPFDLHQIRDRHFDIAARYSDDFDTVRDLVALRTAIKAAPLAPAPVNEAKEKIETVRRSIVEEMQRRQAQYVEGLDMARHFGGLHVSVNAHWVHGHKGAVFLRHFFYLAGHLTQLNTIMAIAQQLEREKEEVA